jgi:hypothetical protein
MRANSHNLITLASENDEKILLPLKWSLVQVQNYVTLETAVKAKHIRDVLVTLGREMVLKLMVLVIKCFVDGVKVKQKIGALEMVELAQYLLENYFGESLEDFILCFKQAKFSGQKLYQSLGREEIMGFVDAYMNQKAEYLEERYRINEKKNQGLDLSSWAEAGETSEEAKKALQAFSEIGTGGTGVGVETHRKKMAIISARFADRDEMELLEKVKRQRERELENQSSK